MAKSFDAINPLLAPQTLRFAEALSYVSLSHARIRIHIHAYMHACIETLPVACVGVNEGRFILIIASNVVQMDNVWVMLKNSKHGVFFQTFFLQIVYPSDGLWECSQFMFRT